MSMNTALGQIKNRVEGHTEGPWRSWQHGDGPRNSGVETTWAYEGDEPVQITDWCFPADAELIAAAPKLLAALEAVEARLSAWQEHAIGMSAEDCTTRALAFMLRSAIEEALR